MTDFFASAIPGIGPILRAELADHVSEVTSSPLFDGRNDLVAFRAKGTADFGEITTAEDIFAEVTAAARQRDVARLAGTLVRRDALERALSVASGQGLRLPANATFRVVARVRTERDFRRTQLRDALTAEVARLRPSWRTGDPAHAELWVLEVEPDRFRLGLRVTPREHRQRGGRAEERPGALRPTVGAAMVRLAGPPAGRLLDPCCGSGTILGEAGRGGWDVTGADLDADAVAVAGANARHAQLFVGDVRAVPVRAGAYGAVATNLPFGHQFGIDDPRRFYAAALAELARVVAPGGSVVILAPRLGPSDDLPIQTKYPVRLLGQRTTLWHLRRRT